MNISNSTDRTPTTTLSRSASAGLCLLLAVLAAPAAAPQQLHDAPPVYAQTLAPNQQALAPLVGTDTLVTVVLTAGGAQDANLRIVEAAPSYFAFITANGERQAYPYTLVKEIRVQRDRVPVRKLVLSTGLALRGAEQEVISRALDRAREIFQSTSDNQSAKMNAAALMAADGDEAGKTYLQQLADTNNLDVALEAAANLYLAGEPVSATLIDRALASGNRKHRVQGARLAGYSQNAAAIPVLRVMLADRSADLSAPAVRALGRLHDEASVPQMVDALAGLNEIKGEAAVFALSHIGGPQVAERVKQSLNQAKGLVWLRHVRVLANIGDPLGKQLLKQEALRIPGLDREAALLLAPHDDWDASEFLRQQLKARNDPNQENLTYKAHAAAALVAANYPPAVSELGRLLRIQEGDVFALGANAPAVKRDTVRSVRITAANSVATLGYPNLMTILQTPIESLDVDVALAACQAALAIADAQFRERLVALNEW
jgi:hypothetical protein